jgi:hypothetical protein
MSPTTRPKRAFNFGHLTPQNYQLWLKFGWPRNIKRDLARLTSLEVSKNDFLVHKESYRDCTQWVITRSLRRPNQIGIHRYDFWHPRFTYPNHPKWVRGPGFYIPGHAATYWRGGLYRLFSLTESELRELDGLTLYELKYVPKGNPGWWHSVKFHTSTRTRDREPLFCIRDYCETSQKAGRPTRRSIICEARSPSLFKALDFELARSEAIHSKLPGPLSNDANEVIVDEPIEVDTELPS